MATVKGPLFSIGASGTIAGAVVYSTWKGRPYVRQHAVPANPKSAGQLSIRAMLRFLSQEWDGQSDATKADWDTRAAATNISPFNAFVAYNLTRWGLNEFPSILDPSVPTVNSGSLANQAATAQSRSIQLEVECDVVADNWGIAVYRSLETGLDGNRNQLVHLIPAGALDTYYWLDFPLTVGVAQFYKFRPFTDNGYGGGLGGEVTATPTA